MPDEWTCGPPPPDAEVAETTRTVAATTRRIELGWTDEEAPPLHSRKEQKHIFSIWSPYEWVSHSR